MNPQRNTNSKFSIFDFITSASLRSSLLELFSVISDNAIEQTNFDCSYWVIPAGPSWKIEWSRSCRIQFFQSNFWFAGELRKAWQSCITKQTFGFKTISRQKQRITSCWRSTKHVGKISATRTFYNRTSRSHFNSKGRRCEKTKWKHLRTEKRGYKTGWTFLYLSKSHLVWFWFWLVEIFFCGESLHNEGQVE